MKVNGFIDLKKKYKASAFRWHVVELYRLGLVSEKQILAELTISRNSLRVWNRAYQRYRLRRYYPSPKRGRLMKGKIDEVALLKKQLADTQKLLQHEQLKREALEIMINIAEKELKIPIRKKPGSGG
jgi:transposase